MTSGHLPGTILTIHVPHHCPPASTSYLATAPAHNIPSTCPLQGPASAVFSPLIALLWFPSCPVGPLGWDLLPMLSLPPLFSIPWPPRHHLSPTGAALCLVAPQPAAAPPHSVPCCCLPLLPPLLHTIAAYLTYARRQPLPPVAPATYIPLPPPPGYTYNPPCLPIPTFSHHYSQDSCGRNQETGLATPQLSTTRGISPHTAKVTLLASTLASPRVSGACFCAGAAAKRNLRSARCAAAW